MLECTEKDPSPSNIVLSGLLFYVPYWRFTQSPLRSDRQCLSYENRGQPAQIQTGQETLERDKGMPKLIKG
jgi:hypothetical protein